MTKIVDTEVRYAWLDEDDRRMSPVHETLGTALGFAGNWHLNYKRLSGELERATTLRDGYKDGTIDPGYPNIEMAVDREQDKIKKICRSVTKLTTTGKSPQVLKRWVITTTLEEPSTAEAEVSVSVLRESIRDFESRYVTTQEDER